MKLQTPLDMHIQNCLVGPYYPIGGILGDWARDFEPLKTAPNTAEFGHINTQKISDSTKNLVKAEPLKYHLSFDKQVWFNQEDGGLIFELEVPRYSRKEISVTIEENTACVFGEKKVGKNSLCFTERYGIPNPHNLDLENCLAKVEDGLLSIAFPKKFVAPKTIRVL